MKTFKEYISEVEEIDYIDKAKVGVEGAWENHRTENELIANNFKHISTTKSGHRVYYKGIKHPKGGMTTTEYFAVHPKTRKIHIGVAAQEHNNVLSDLSLGAYPKNTLKGHDFYHHLITHHDKVLVGSSQTPGSHKVWKDLQKYHRDVNVHGWRKGNPVNIDMRDDEYTHAPTTYSYGSMHGRSYSPEAHDAMITKLVAHKKDK